MFNFNRFILVTIILVFVYSTENLGAQNKLTKPEKYVGINFGATGSKINFKPSVDQAYSLGYNGGLVFRYVGHKVAGLQAEINYSQRGWSESDGLYSRRLDYIEIPFMTQFYVGNKFRVFFNIGPKFSYLINEEEFIHNTTDLTKIQHITPAQNLFDYGFCGGPGFLLNIKGQVIQFDARANFSVSDVFSNAKRDYFDYSNNMNLSINLGWQFQLSN